MKVYLFNVETCYPHNYDIYNKPNLNKDEWYFTALQAAICKYPNQLLAISQGKLKHFSFTDNTKQGWRIS